MICCEGTRRLRGSSLLMLHMFWRLYVLFASCSLLLIVIQHFAVCQPRSLWGQKSMCFQTHGWEARWWGDMFCGFDWIRFPMATSCHVWHFVSSQSFCAAEPKSAKHKSFQELVLCNFAVTVPARSSSNCFDIIIDRELFCVRRKGAPYVWHRWVTSPGCGGVQPAGQKQGEAMRDMMKLIKFSKSKGKLMQHPKCKSRSYFYVEFFWFGSERPCSKTCVLLATGLDKSMGQKDGEEMTKGNQDEERNQTLDKVFLCRSVVMVAEACSFRHARFERRSEQFQWIGIPTNTFVFWLCGNFQIIFKYFLASRMTLRSCPICARSV